MTALPPYKRDVSMVFQSYALFPHMAVHENVAYGPKNRKVRNRTTPDSKAAEGKRIVLVRPESIRISGERISPGNCFPAAVVQNGFLGNKVRCEANGTNGLCL